MTKADMRAYTRWLMDQLGVQWLPQTALQTGEGTSNAMGIDLAMARGIERYAVETESYRVRYTLTTTALSTTPSEAIYVLSAFSPSGTAYGTTDATRAFRIMDMTYDGHKLTPIWDKDSTSTWALQPGHPRNWFLFDGQSIKILPPPNAAKVLLLDAYVMPLPTATGVFSTDTTVWPAFADDADLPCYFAAIWLATRTTGAEVAQRVAEWKSVWTTRIAAARARIHKSDGKFVIGINQVPQRTGVCLPEVVPLAGYPTW